MSEFIDDPWDDREDFDGCEHGRDFSEYCPYCEDDPIGCVFPGKCIMSGIHLESECATAEIMEEIEKHAQ